MKAPRCHLYIKKTPKIAAQMRLPAACIKQRGVVFISRFLSSTPLHVDTREPPRNRHGVLKSGWLPYSFAATAQQHYLSRATRRLAFASLTVVHLYTQNVPSPRSTCDEAIGPPHVHVWEVFPLARTQATRRSTGWPRSSHGPP